MIYKKGRGQWARGIAIVTLGLIAAYAGYELYYWLEDLFAGEHAVERLLFSVELESSAELDEGVTPDALRQAFAGRGRALSQHALVSVKQKGSEWAIRDGEETYGVRREADAKVYNVHSKLPKWLRDGIPVAAAALVFAGVLAGTLYYALVHEKASSFLIETQGEMKRVTWPRWREVLGASGVVILIVALLGSLIALVDGVLSWVLEKIVYS